MVSALTSRIVNWVTTRFGVAVALDRQERALRLLEESLELAQAEGVPLDKVASLACHVYDRPVGEPAQELAGVAVCVLAYAHAANADVLDLARQEVERIEKVDPAISRARHDAKAATGLGMPSRVTTTDGAPPAPGREYGKTGAPQPTKANGQHAAYWILTADERAKGFVRPVRRSYVHGVCGTKTTMSREIAETYARDPKFYGLTFCCYCRQHLPVAEFRWDDGSGEGVGS